MRYLTLALVLATCIIYPHWLLVLLIVKLYANIRIYLAWREDWQERCLNKIPVVPYVWTEEQRKWADGGGLVRWPG